MRNEENVVRKISKLGKLDLRITRKKMTKGISHRVKKYSLCISRVFLKNSKTNFPLFRENFPNNPRTVIARARCTWQVVLDKVVINHPEPLSLFDLRVLFELLEKERPGEHVDTKDETEQKETGIVLPKAHTTRPSTPALHLFHPGSETKVNSSIFVYINKINIHQVRHLGGFCLI